MKRRNYDQQINFEILYNATKRKYRSGEWRWRMMICAMRSSGQFAAIREAKKHIRKFRRNKRK